MSIGIIGLDGERCVRAHQFIGLRSWAAHAPSVGTRPCSRNCRIGTAVSCWTVATISGSPGDQRTQQTECAVKIRSRPDSFSDT